MTLQALLEFATTENQRLKEKYGNTESDRERVFGATIKLTEEVGELCSEVLSSQGLQRQEKLNGANSESLASEVADVFITTLLLSQRLGVDIEDALAKKIEKINKRYES